MAGGGGFFFFFFFLELNCRLGNDEGEHDVLKEKKHRPQLLLLTFWTHHSRLQLS